MRRCDYIFYPNYLPLTRQCRREGIARSCGHLLCERHARRHETVCVPPPAMVGRTLLPAGRRHKIA